MSQKLFRDLFLTIYLIERNQVTFLGPRFSPSCDTWLSEIAKDHYQQGCQVSISSTFYVCIFHTKVLCKSFSLVMAWLCNFLAQKYQRKSCL